MASMSNESFPLLTALESAKDDTQIEIEEYDEINNNNNDNPFKDPSVANYWLNKYQQSQYECRFHFDPEFSWSVKEEAVVLTKLQYRVTFIACLMFVGLQIDRGNLNQAISDNLLGDLALTTDDYNLTNTLSKFAFLLAEIPSGLICKWLGPDVWLPIQMITWSLIAIAQGFVYNKTTFIMARVAIHLLEGGFIAEMVLWLSYFFTSKELSLRLSYFWGSSAAAQCICGVLAFILLRLRGVFGLEGWRWLFIIEGVFTLIIGISSYFLIVPSPVETKSPWCPQGWFTYNEEKIVVNRVLRDDPSKGDMHNRQAITPQLLWKAIMDYDLWPTYFLGFIAFIPANTLTNYFTLNLKIAGYSTFDVNILTIPYNLFHIVFLVIITKISEHFNERTLISLISPLWVIPGLLILRYSTVVESNKFLMFIILTFILSQPYIHAINTSLVSRNSNSIKTRSISAALYNMFNQAGSMVAANIYTSSDSPHYHKGNERLLWLSIFTVVYLLGTKGYYLWRNRQKERIWKQWDWEQREYYIHNTKDEGNKRLDFRFSH